jgi:hypothetical protein
MQRQERARPDALFQPIVQENGVVGFVAQIDSPRDPEAEPGEQQQRCYRAEKSPPLISSHHLTHRGSDRPQAANGERHTARRNPLAKSLFAAVPA